MGSSETVLDADLNVLYGGGTPSELVDRLKLQFGRLRFEMADLDGRKARSPVFPLVFLALKEQGARDYGITVGGAPAGPAVLDVDPLPALPPVPLPSATAPAPELPNL